MTTKGHTADCPRFHDTYPWQCDCQANAALTTDAPATPALPESFSIAISDDGVMTALPAWPRNDHTTSLRLMMASITVGEATIAIWTDDQWREADVWSCSVHLSASDNDDIQVPRKPAFLPAYDGIRATAPETLQ